MMAAHRYNYIAPDVFVRAIVRGKTLQMEHQQQYPHKQLCLRYIQ